LSERTNGVVRSISPIELNLIISIFFNSDMSNTILIAKFAVKYKQILASLKRIIEVYLIWN